MKQSNTPRQLSLQFPRCRTKRNPFFSSLFSLAVANSCSFSNKFASRRCFWAAKSCVVNRTFSQDFLRIGVDGIGFAAVPGLLGKYCQLQSLLTEEIKVINLRRMSKKHSVNLKESSPVLHASLHPSGNPHTLRTSSPKAAGVHYSSGALRPASQPGDMSVRISVNAQHPFKRQGLAPIASEKLL